MSDCEIWFDKDRGIIGALVKLERTPSPNFVRPVYYPAGKLPIGKPATYKDAIDKRLITRVNMPNLLGYKGVFRSWSIYESGSEEGLTNRREAELLRENKELRENLENMNISNYQANEFSKSIAFGKAKENAEKDLQETKKNYPMDDFIMRR